MTVGLRLCIGGSCRQLEHFVLRSYRPRLLRFPAMFAIIEHPREGVILFDTGYAQRFFDATRRFPERLYAITTPVTLGPDDSAVAKLAALGLAPSDVRTVLISHFHADHVAGLMDFPRARLRCLSSAWHSVRNRSRVSALRHGFLPALMPGDFEARLDPLDTLTTRPLPPDCAPFTHGLDVFGDESVLAVELGGHAAGQVGLIVHAHDGRRYFLVSDACWTREAFERPVLPHPVASMLFHDTREYARTLGKIADLSRRSPSIVIVPSHCERTLRTCVEPQA
jgi:glyoxylase-like metal-dependent hydrolase (beta-lactamase superfamily II)